MKEKSKVLDKIGIQKVLTRIAHEIIEKNKNSDDLIVVGIVTRGAHLAKRLAKIISEIDKKLEALESERAILLYIRNFAMKEASHILEPFKNSDTRRIIRYALDEHDISVKSISESLNLREAVVRQALLKLKKSTDVGVEFVDKETKKNSKTS